MLFVLIFGVLVIACQSERILVLWMSYSYSHWAPVEPLFQKLAARGHQVTVFSIFPQKTPLPNYTDVDFSKLRPPNNASLTIDGIRSTMGTPEKTLEFIYKVNNASCEMIARPEFQNLLKSKNQYDLLITELFATDCFTYFAYKLKIPLISFTACLNIPWASERTGIPDGPSYIPNLLLRVDSKMNIAQRTNNALFNTYSKFKFQWIHALETRELTQKLFGEELPPLDQVVANTSLVLINSYHALSQSRPFPPNVVEVGGLHIKKSKPLPKDLEEILNNAKHGVIVMSFGSLVRTSSLPKTTILMFMRAFAKMPQTVLFKYEEDLPEAPPNVIIRKWLPQRDLVEHKRVVAVVGHGGLHSTIEAVQFGKPLVGVPFFGDQPVNVAAVAGRGAGVALDIDALTQEDVERALDKVVNDPTYKENMRQLSLQFRDRPMSPLDTAVFWVEYVIRHKGARHLRPASVELPFYQYLLLDVLALVVVTLATIVYLIVFLCRRAYRRLVAWKNTKEALHGKKIN